MGTYCARTLKVYTVASGGNTGRKTSLTAGTPQAKSTTTEPETANVKVEKDKDAGAISSRIPYSPKNPRKKGYHRIPWVSEIIDRGKVVVVNIHHGDDPVRTMFVDKADADKVKYPVRLDRDGHAINRGSPPQFVHHAVLGFKFDPKVDKEVDHVNRNPLDNRRRNLRFLTVRGNNLNHPAHKGNSTGIRGLNRDVYVDKEGKVRYQAYEAIIVNPHEKIDPKIGKAKQYRKKFYFGKNGLPESEARRQGESWLNQMAKKFERERLDMTVCGSTTIPGGSRIQVDPKWEAPDKGEDIV